MQGYAVGEVKPSFEAWALRVHRDDFENTKAELERAKEQRREYIDEFRVVHPDGTVRWCSSRGRFFYDAGGRAVRMIGVMEDTTERRHSLEMQQTLIAELQHRTRNLLSIVRSISQQTARSSSSLEEFSTEFGERLAAMSRVQGLLSRGDGFSVTLGELIRAELSAHGAPVDGTQIEINGPRVVLSSREVQVLTLALHELTTNAVKYGALSQPEAKLQISWSLQNGDSARTVAIEWAESGVVLPAGSDADKRGFGRELIERALPYDLGAKTKFEIGPDGVRCELKVPLRQGGEETGPHGEAADNEPAHPPR
jgi:PAS domain S-box-containing protein